MCRVALFAVLLTACGPARTSARLPPGPPFDPTQSDPEALAIADAGATALAGPDAWQTWEGVKQLAFTARYTVSGELKVWSVHHWDRWNGRHNFRSADLAAEVDEGEPPPWLEAFYDLYDDDAKPTALYDGNELAHDDGVKFRKQGRERLQRDGFLLTFAYRVRDPGVRLALDGDNPPGSGVCDPSCKRVKITFEPSNGRDTYVIDYNATTKRPELIEQNTDAGLVAYKLDGWTEVGGLSFPTQLQNVGYEAEVLEFSELAIGDPDDALYIPQVTGD